MPVSVNDTIYNYSPKALDGKHGKWAAGIWQPYASVAEANSMINVAYRHRGLTVIINVSGTPTEYWYRDGVADGNLIPRDALSTLDTETISLFGEGTPSSPLYGDVNISVQQNNAIISTSTGVYAGMVIREGVVYGGVVTWLQDYTYHVSAAGYYINGRFYESPNTIITLSDPDGTFNRIDTFIVDTDGVASVLEGAPSNNPSQAPHAPATQLELSFALVETGTTEPSQLAVECLYQENIEWTSLSSNLTRLNPNSSTAPCAGTKTINGTSVINGDNLSLTRGSVLDLASIHHVLRLQIKSKGNWTNNRRLILQWQLAGVNVGGSVQVGNGMYSFVSSNTVDCQYISIPISDFGLVAGNNVDRLLITAQMSNGSIGFYIDNICLQGMTTPPPATAEDTNFAEDDLTATGNRIHDFSGFDLTINELDTLTLQSSAATPTHIGKYSQDSTFAEIYVKDNTADVEMYVGAHGSGKGDKIRLMTYSNTNTLGSLLQLDSSALTFGLTIDESSIDFTQPYLDLTGAGFTFGNIPTDNTITELYGPDSNGRLAKRTAASLGSSITANNGLTANTATNVQLGGTAIQNTNIDWSNFTFTNTWNTLSGSGLILSSTSTAAASGNQKVLEVILSGANAISTQTTYGIYSHNSHTGTTPTNIGVFGQVSNGIAGSVGVYGNAVAGQIGVRGTSASGYGVYATSGSSNALYAETTSGANGAAILISNPTSTNTIVPQLRLLRNTSGTAANGIGGGIDFYVETTTSGSSGNLTNSIQSSWTDATDASRTSQLTFWGVNNTISEQYLTIKGGGQAQLNKYGGGTFTGTPTKWLAVDATGNVIEEDAPTGSSYTFENGLTETTGTVKLGGTLTEDSTIIGSSSGLSIYLDDDGVWRGFSIAARNTSALYGSTFSIEADDTYGSAGMTTKITNSGFAGCNFDTWDAGGGVEEHSFWHKVHGVYGGLANTVTIQADVTSTSRELQFQYNGNGVNQSIIVPDRTGVVGGTFYMPLSVNGTVADSTGNITIATGGITTADNGLTANTATNVRLGGTLVEDTTIAQSGFRTTFSGAWSGSPQYMFSISNSGTGGALSVTASSGAAGAFTTSTGAGLFVNTTSGAGVDIRTTGGLAINTRTNTAGTNDVAEVFRLQRQSTGTPAAGMGGRISYYIETTSSDDRVAANWIWRWTDATDATRTSELLIQGVNSASTTDILTLAGSGAVRLNQGLSNYSDDTAAAAGGIPVGGLYRNGSVVMIRVT